MPYIIYVYARLILPQAAFIPYINIMNNTLIPLILILLYLYLSITLWLYNHFITTFIL
ncbi:hypothetical protein [Sulfolobus tengchongensis spindle-shaped virus 3]|nr:hypothetical protein [Sulfolobus tengchongensis spindle-shaped virus 3]